jgi:nucleotide-binding universal stress UspA family protein
MKRKILLPTDFSDNAWSAVVYALKLYKNESCTFYFLNSAIIKVSAMSNLSNKLLEVMKKDALSELQDLKKLAEATNANANHSFEIILSTLDLTTAIRKTVNELEIELVVMGTKGATGAKEFFFGSNTVNVIQGKMACPVLMVPEEFDFIELNQIAFPTDFSRSFSKKELKPLKQVAELYNSKIRIVHINEEEILSDFQESNLEQLKSSLEDYETTFHWMPDYAKKAITINDFIEELDINLLVMLSYKHSLIEKLIKEPVIKKIGLKPTIPFLVIPE